MNHQNLQQKLGGYQRVFTVLALIVSLASSPVSPVFAADVSSTVYSTQAKNASVRDGFQFVVPGDRTATNMLAQAKNAIVTAITPKKPTVKTMKMDVSAYTSAVDECDADPFVTADGSTTADGIVATNVLPFGTRIRIPAYFGDKIFEVHDRMNTRYSYRVDIWMQTKPVAFQFGVKRSATIEIVEMGNGTTQWARIAKEHQTAKAAKLAEAAAMN